MIARIETEQSYSNAEGVYGMMARTGEDSNVLIPLHKSESPLDRGIVSPFQAYFQLFHHPQPKEQITAWISLKGGRHVS